MRKLGAEDWLVNIVQLMYRNARSRVRVNETFSDDFLVQVGLHKGSVLSPSLFIIGLKVLSIEIGSGCPEELFYADDLALVSGKLDALKGILEVWKKALELKGLTVNVKKKK